MKVRDLIEELEMYDGDADVLIMTQPQYPFESSIRSVSSRDQFSAPEGGDSVSFDGFSRSKQTDVFIVEGSQVRYGDEGAWDC